jgi:hypothetical protein
MNMKKYGLLTIISLSLLILNGCEKDYYSTAPVEITGPVSFSEDVIPIFTADCAIPTCHVNGGYAPDLSPANAYNELTGLGYVDTSNAEQSVLYKSITGQTNPMPPSTPLTAEEIGYILAWIEQGAQNN